MYKVIMTSNSEVTEFKARYRAEWMAEDFIESCKMFDEESGEVATYKIEKC